MNCPSCGQPIKQGAAFCGNCGHALTSAAAPGPTPDQAQARPPAAPAQPQNASPFAQTFNNQAPTPSAGNFGSPAAGVAVGGPGGASTYAAAPTAASNAGETRAIIGLILGVIGIPASLIPLAGLIFGLAGLVLGTTARVHYRHLVSLLAIIFSSLAILVALSLWVYNAEHYNKTHNVAATGQNAGTSSNASANLKAITTPCYKVQISSGLNSYTPNGCNFDSASTGEEYTVQAIDNPNVTTADLAQYGQKALASGAKAINGSVVSGKSGNFAGSPAYIDYINAPGGQRGIFGVVLHKSANQLNVFMVAHVVKGSSKPDFGTLETNWQWK